MFSISTSYHRSVRWWARQHSDQSRDGHVSGMLLRTLLRLGVFTLLACAGTVVPAQGREAEVITTQIGPMRVLPPDFLGYNLDLGARLQDWHSAPFLAAVRALQPGTLRYPGGTLSNYWNWRSGNFDAAGRQRYRGWRRLHPQLHFGLGDLQSGLQASGAQAVFDLNLLSGTLANAEAELHAAQAKGIAVRYVELGNEFYLSTPDNVRAFPEAQNYAAKATRWAQALHAAFPQARIAAVGAYMFDPAWAQRHQPRIAGWNHRVMAALHGVDAMTMHIYVPTGIYLRRHHLRFDAASIPALLGYTLQQMHQATTQMRAFGTLPVWVTEYNQTDWHKVPAPWGMRELPGPVDGTWTQALIVAAQTLALAQDPQVRLADVHALVSQGAFGALFATAQAFGPQQPAVRPLARSASGVMLQAIAHVLHGATRLAPLYFAGAPTLPGGASSLMGVEVWRGDGPPALLVLNLGAQAQSLQLPSLPAGATWQTLSAVPTDRLLDAARQITRQTGTLQRTLNLPGYALLSVGVHR